MVCLIVDETVQCLVHPGSIADGSFDNIWSNLVCGIEKNLWPSADQATFTNSTCRGYQR
jgi:hypothetical protein